MVLPDTTVLLAFAIASILLIVAPGPDTLYVAGRGMARATAAAHNSVDRYTLRMGFLRRGPGEGEQNLLLGAQARQHSDIRWTRSGANTAGTPRSGGFAPRSGRPAATG